MPEQEFADYSSKYQDLKENITHKTDKQKTSILEDIDFELELICRDSINVSYIIKLLIKLKAQNGEKDKESIEKEILNLLNTEVTLRSKRELIEKFINENLIDIDQEEDILESFEKYWNQQQVSEFNKIIQEENLSAEKTEKLIEDYLFSEREPRRDEILNLMDEKDQPGALHRKSVGDRILKRIVDFVETFINGMNLN